MVNAYSAIINFEGDNFQDYLDKIYLLKVFEDIFKEYPDIEICKKIIKFIAWGYGMDSDMLLLQGNTWGKTAPEIFKRAGLPEELKDDVCWLKNDSILSTIDKWLRFQNDENYTQYITYRDLRRQMLAYSLAELKKSSGEVDIQSKMDAAINSEKLLEMMNNAKETFIQNHPKLKGSVDAFNKANDKAKVTRSVGSYAV